MGGFQPLKTVNFDFTGHLCVCQNCLERPYCEFEVPEDAGKIQSIEFTTVSHDQGDTFHPLVFPFTDDSSGWTSGCKNPEEPYAGSYTWFVVAARRRVDQYNVPFHYVVLQHNITAGPGPREHVNTWSGPKDPLDYGEEALFVGSLGPGDIIQVFPRACYIEWVNYVYQVSVNISYEPRVVDESTQPRLLTDESTADVNIYKVLDEDRQEIRLLRVLPASSLEADVVCEIYRFSFLESRQQDYDALSYHWGSPDALSTLILRVKGQEHTIKVTTNAVDALRHLRKNDTSLLVWVDALCIYQRDVDERAKQVRLMDRIYRQAEHVHIWLGHRVSDQTALKIFHDGYNYFRGHCRGGQGCEHQGCPHTMTVEDHQLFTSTQAHDRMEEVAHFHLDGKEGRRFKGNGFLGVMHWLFQNPWFRRIWVIQEILNARQPIVHAGLVHIPWTEIIETYAIVSIQGYYCPHLEPITRLPYLWTFLCRSFRPKIGVSSGVSNTRIPSIEDPVLYREPGILEIFLYALGMNASDVRDKIFAILSLGCETKELSSLPEEILPNYERSPAEVFANFTRWWIKTHNSLLILSTIHGRYGRTWQDLSPRLTTVVSPAVHSLDIPSWTLRPGGKRGWAKKTLAYQYHFVASGETIPAATLLESVGNPLELQLLGYTISRIEARSHLIYDTGHSSLETITDVYLNILDSELTENKDPLPPGESVGVFQCKGNVFQGHLHPNQSPRSDDENESELLTESRKEMQSSIKPPAKHFFVAENGLWGLCPAEARDGDFIVVLFGGDVPFLLRGIEDDKNTGESVNEGLNLSGNPDGKKTASELPTKNLRLDEQNQSRYRLVGECYLSHHHGDGMIGYMNGSVIEQMRFEGKEPEVFTLV